MGYFRPTVRAIRRVFILVAGLTTMLVGVALLVLPGPGLLIIAAGLALLATEFLWARVWMKRARDKAVEFGDGARASLFARKAKDETGGDGDEDDADAGAEVGDARPGTARDGDSGAECNRSGPAPP